MSSIATNSTYLADPQVLTDHCAIIRRIGQDVGLQASLIRQDGDSAAGAVGDPGLAELVREATARLASAAQTLSGDFDHVHTLFAHQATALRRGSGEEPA